MLIAKVIGTVVAPVKHPSYENLKLLLVQPLNLPGEQPEEVLLAVDNQHAGVGDTVLILQEGNSTRQVVERPNAPIRSCVAGIIDSVSLSSDRGR